LALDILKRQILAALKGDLRDQLKYIIDTLFTHPEVGGKELSSSKLLVEMLGRSGFETKQPIANLPTAFKASYSAGSKQTPVVAFLTEYDALPNLGHACGHNTSCAASIGAALSLSSCVKTEGLNGMIIVMGTPGEENLAYKVDLLKAGEFQGIDAALMVHADDRWLLEPRVMALDAFEFLFTGKAAHAAASPEKGINALDAVHLTFNAISFLRQHLRDGTRVHGIVTQGGDAPNIIPEIASATVYVRSEDSLYLNDISRRVVDCARGAALATGCELKVDSVENHQDSLISSPVLIDLFKHNLSRFVDSSEIKMREDTIWASTDAGNVSYVVPTIQPLMAIATHGTPLHTKEFAIATISPEALDAVIWSAYAMACTALELFTDKGLQESLRKEADSLSSS
jgi:amidohydrolase